MANGGRSLYLDEAQQLNQHPGEKPCTHDVVLGSAATNAKGQMVQNQREPATAKTGDWFCLPPDHKVKMRVDQTQSTVVRSPQVSRVPITHSRASIRLGRALQDARNAPRENRGQPSRSHKEKANQGSPHAGRPMILHPNTKPTRDQGSSRLTWWWKQPSMFRLTAEQ